MDEKKYPRLISDREMKEWIPGCPAQVKGIRIEQAAEGAAPQITVVTAKCTEFNVTGVILTVELLNDRREVIGKISDVSVPAGESAPIVCPESKVKYAFAVIERVEIAGGEPWINENNSRGIKLPDQDLFWTTDSLYDQIKRECEGVVEAKYKPDRIDGAWRCACGQVNLAESASCGGCGCSLQWLDEHLERTYLEEQKKIADEKSEKELVREKKRKQRQPSDKVKAILILAGIALLIVLVILTITFIIPSVRYSHAQGLLEKGEFDKSIDIFYDLGDFRDSADRAYEATYKKAQFVTGLEEVYMTTSAAEPWYSIDETGMLSFNRDKYEKGKKSWEHITVPDIVDGIMVTSLERNFFINCKEMLEVTISDCVEEIGEQTFLNCEMLEKVNFGKNIRVIGSRTFIDCHALREITIPDTVESIGARAFNNCINLKKVVFGKGITQLPDYIFSLCTSLESITLSSPITRIGDFALSECGNLKTIFCRFSESEWTEPDVGSENPVYENVKLSFDN